MPPSFENGCYLCMYNENENVWETVIFPSLNPKTREDVLKLDEWIQHSVVELGKEFNNVKEKDIEDSKKLINNLIKTYDIAFQEIIRQINLDCKERSELLNRIWKCKNEIYLRKIDILNKVYIIYSRKKKIYHK